MKHASDSINAPFETIYVTHPRIACDGGGGALGHPRVYLTIDADTHHVTCPYCSRTYALKEGHH
jgi:uncharacterized Zn-finger protein